MLLSCRILDNVGSVNYFDTTTQVEYTQGTGHTVYLQLVDTSKDRGLNPAGRRYAAVAGATLQVVVDSIDDAKKVTRTCTQPFSGDSSIWTFQMLATDTIRGTANLRLRLTEGSNVTYGTLRNGMSISAQDAN